MKKVLKYGGSSLSSVEQIIATGEYIASLEGEIIVVVSAMGDTTDKLIELAKSIDTNNSREIDVLLSTGEICSSALVAMAIRKSGRDAISLSGGQAGIITNNNHTDADIIYIDTTRVEKELEMGKTVIVAGFQGITENGEITTLGRGGSDTTAVALAAALNCPCEIYTDVDGVFEADPIKRADAKRFNHITYDKMIELSMNGADVLNLNAALIAKKNKVSLFIGKSLEQDKSKGTFVGENPLNIAVIGASGLVGRTFLKVLEEREIDTDKVYLFGNKSVGKRIEFKGEKLRIEELTEENIRNKDIDYVFLFAEKEISMKYAPIFAGMGITVIDNSSAWRMNDDVPLIISQVNGDKVYPNKNIISNPNCSTIQCLIPICKLHNKYTVKSINFTTFQAVSGSGMKGIADLTRTQKGDNSSFYPYSIADNCIPQIGDILADGYTEEEMKMVNETRKILGNNEMSVSATCVRVPILNGHSVEISVELEHPFEIEEIKDELRHSENIVVCDTYPVTEMSNGTDDVYVGRLRRDISNPQVLHMWCTADNLRRGAATNAVEILRLLERRKYDS